MPQRLIDHERGKAALWTKRRRPLQLVYAQVLTSHLEASRREKQVKRWSRQKKINLIIGIWK